MICFSLKTALHLFTRSVEPLVTWAHAHGIQILIYLDDWLVLHLNSSTLLVHSQFVLSKAIELGWVVNFKKSKLVPSQDFIFLGMRCNTQLNRVFPHRKEDSVRKT